PPLADAPAGGLIRTASFELPVASPVGAESLSTMPYLTDDPAPPLLPPLGDVPMLSPAPDADNPLYHAVKRFVDDAAKAPGDVTDKVPLGKPPLSEHPSAVAPQRSVPGP